MENFNTRSKDQRIKGSKDLTISHFGLLYQQAGIVNPIQIQGRPLCAQWRYLLHCSSFV
ncbi:MAG TPA: hypothetical protein PLC04_07655 [Candidatus Kapabacteria bacterium]|nr:hypothetical protein [Candidatus Kapabacteria bacterium]